MTVTSSKRKASSSATAANLTSDTTTLETVGMRYSCDYCYRDISSIVRIQCAECGLPPLRTSTSKSSPVKVKGAISSPVEGSEGNSATLEEVDLCVECFAAGVEFGTHKKHHPYRILRPLDFAIYQEDWRADEELLLLEAIEANGVGNWQDLADQLGSRNPDECQQHYCKVYLTNPNGPTPLAPEIIKASREQFKEQEMIKRPKFLSSEEAIALYPVLPSTPANHEITGYMVLREEFETEFENDAEAHIKDLQFNEDDTPAERRHKFTLLDIYTLVLEKRAARHVFIKAHNLHEFKRQLAIDKARSREEKEIYAQLKPFARFVGGEDFQKLLDGLVREEELRRQLAHLQELRRNGIRSFDEVPAFEVEKKHLELYLKGGSPYGGGSGPTITNFSSSSSLSLAMPVPFGPPPQEPHPLPSKASLLKKKAGPALPSGGSRVSSTLQSTILPSVVPSAPVSPSPPPLPPSSVPEPSPTTNTSGPMDHSSSFGSSTNNHLTATTPTPISASAPVAATNGVHNASSISKSVNVDLPMALSLASTTFGPASSGGRKASTPLNISHADGVELLSEKERHLCSILRLYPRLYLSIKDTLIREYLKLGGLKRAQARSAVKIDVNKTSKLYDFFVAAGWIKPPESGE